MKIYNKLSIMNEQNQNCDGDERKIQGRLDLAYKIERKIKVECIQQARKENIKYVVFLIVFVTLSLTTVYEVIPLINYLFSSQKESKELRDQLDDYNPLGLGFIPSDITINEVVSDT